MLTLLAVHVPIEALLAGLSLFTVALVKVVADVVKNKKNGGGVTRIWESIGKTDDNVKALTNSVQTMQVLQAEDRTNLANLTAKLGETHTDLRELLRKGTQ